MSRRLPSQTVEIDGETTIHFWGPTAATSKPPIVLIHGFGPHDVWQWRSQISFFSREFDVYVPYLVFFGDSFTDSADKSEVFQAVSVAKLLEKLGIRRVQIGKTEEVRLGAETGCKMAQEKPKSAGVWPTVKPFVNGGASGMLATCVIQPIDMI